MEADWTSLTDEQLLDRRISKLGLKLEGSGLEALIKQLYDELSAKRLGFHPPCHIGDEWFVPVGIPAIFIPFFLVHERLRALEKTMMLEVEGGTPDSFMRLIRHEAAHAYSYAYYLPRKKKWQEAFGKTSRDQTPDVYHPQPFSRGYVVNLDDWYAQSHPDEDFAETFAVWLTPETDWRKRYGDWKAIQKLEYVDELMRTLAGKPPIHMPEYRAAEYDCLNQKLKTYYAQKRKVLALFDAIRPTKIDQDLSKEMKTEDWKTEANVLAALGILGHATEHLAIFDNLDLLRQKMDSFGPDVIFNLADQFKNNRGFDQHIASLLEMQGVPFTGCGATGLVLCKHKGTSKKILGYHHIHVPNFVVIPRGQRIARLKRPKFPLLVKPVKEEASYGISPALVAEIEDICKRIYRLLTIEGYARIDLRLTSDNKLYFIEANPNPILAEDEDFAQAAAKAGVSYPQLIDRIIAIGMRTVRG